MLVNKLPSKVIGLCHARMRRGRGSHVVTSHSERCGANRAAHSLGYLMVHAALSL